MSGSKTIKRLEAFKAGTGIYGANTSSGELAAAAKRRQEARYAESVKTLQKRMRQIDTAASAILEDMPKVDLAAALQDAARRQLAVDALEKATKALAEVRAVVDRMVGR